MGSLRSERQIPAVACGPNRPSQKPVQNWPAAARKSCCWMWGDLHPPKKETLTLLYNEYLCLLIKFSLLTPLTHTHPPYTNSTAATIGAKVSRDHCATVSWMSSWNKTNHNSADCHTGHMTTVLDSYWYGEENVSEIICMTQCYT